MAKHPKKVQRDIELVPDAWERFERFVMKAAKSGPHHRKSKTKGKRKSR